MTKSNYYVSDSDLLPEIWEWQKTGQMSNELGRMIMLIADNLLRHGSFHGYTQEWKEDMKGRAIETVIKYGRNFESIKKAAPRPFPYLTMIIRNSFLVAIKQNKKHTGIKNELYDRMNFEMQLEFEEVGCFDYSKMADPSAAQYRKKKTV